MADVPPEVAAWLERQALTVVPRAAAELLVSAVEDRIALDRTRRVLRSIANEQGDGSLASLVEYQEHRHALVTARLDAAEALIAALLAKKPTKPLEDAWRRARSAHERKIA